MADINVFFYDDVIRDTPDAMKLPAPSGDCVEITTLEEAMSVVETMVALGEFKAAAVAQGGLFFYGATATAAGMQVIHTPASMAYLDEHKEGWRHQLALPITPN